MQYFKTIFLIDAEEFISGLDKKTAKKVLYNIRLAEKTNDVRLFKKLDDMIGNLEPAIWDCKFAYWLFGIERMIRIV